MDNSIYITLSRQVALFRDMEVTANNIANSNTTGFNAEHMLFNSYLTKDVSQRRENPMAFDYDIATYRNMQSGPLHKTGNALDLAIQGDGYFAVETPLGTRYTRAGNFQVDNVGTLMTSEGYPVLDTTNRHITFPEETRDITVGEAGNLLVNGEELTSIAVYQFANPQLLERLNGAMFRSEVAPIAADSSARVSQGVLEGANVQPVIELTHMMDVSRSVGNTAKFIESMYDLQRKASNTWAQQG